MRKLLILLLLSSSLHAQPVQINGLMIPGDAVQVSRGSAAVVPAGPAWSRTDLYFEYLPENYAPNIGISAAQWTNTGSYGGVASQAVEARKPTTRPATEKRIIFNLDRTGCSLDHAVPTQINGACTWVIAGNLGGGVYSIYNSGSAGYSRFDFRGGTTFQYYDYANGSYIATTTSGVFIRSIDASGTYRTYKDGVLLLTSAPTGVTVGVKDPRLILGDNAYPIDQPFTGGVNTFLWYRRCLDDAEVAQLTADIVAYFGNDNITRALP